MSTQAQGNRCHRQQALLSTWWMLSSNISSSTQTKIRRALYRLHPKTQPPLRPQTASAGADAARLGAARAEVTTRYQRLGLQTDIASN